jgi:hypothetical protein
MVKRRNGVDHLITHTPHHPISRYFFAPFGDLLVDPGGVDAAGNGGAFAGDVRVVQGVQGYLVPAARAFEQLVEAAGAAERVAEGEYLVVAADGDTGCGFPDLVVDAAGLVDDDEEVGAVVALERDAAAGLAGGDADGIGAVVEAQAGFEQLAGQLNAGALNPGVNLLPERFFDLVHGGRGGDDDGGPLGVEEPEGEIGGDVGLADAVAAADDDAVESGERLADLGLRGPPAGAEYFEGELARVVVVFGEVPIDGAVAGAASGRVDELAEELGFELRVRFHGSCPSGFSSASVSRAVRMRVRTRTPSLARASMTAFWKSRRAPSRRAISFVRAASRMWCRFSAMAASRT